LVIVADEGKESISGEPDQIIIDPSLRENFAGLQVQP